ncbi:MAG: extensin family protein [Polyangia bacterium]
MARPVAPRNPVAQYLETPSDITSTAAYRYGQIGKVECEAELKRRQIPFKREPARGVFAGVRLTGPLRGVLFRGEGTDQERARSPHEIVSCRLVLALYDAAETLLAHDIAEVRHYSMYRLPPESWPWARPAERHLGGVAIDAGRFIKKDGSVLDVDKHFHGAIGARTCGPGAAPRPATAQALELRKLLCELVARRLFNVVLTPNYNAPHKNHFHLEVTSGKRWFLVH